MIRMLNSFLKALAFPAFKVTICLTCLPYDDSKLCGFPYFLWTTAIALLYLYSGLSFMKLLIRSLVSPLVYWINRVNLHLGSSIFFPTHSLNIGIKYIYSIGLPSNGSKSTCTADCSFTNLQNICFILSCSRTSGSFCTSLSLQWR